MSQLDVRKTLQRDTVLATWSGGKLLFVRGVMLSSAKRMNAITLQRRCAMVVSGRKARKWGQY